MKNLLKMSALTTGLLAMNALWAAPKVGEFSVLDGHYWQSGQTLPVSVRTENTQYDANKNEMLLRTTSTVIGQPPQVEEEWRKADELISQENAPFIADAFCQSKKDGNIENVTTPAGTFKTCKYPVNESNTTGFMWVGGVPNGIIKLDLADSSQGITYKGELKEFSWK